MRAEVAKLSPRRKDEVLVALNNRDKKHHDLHRIDIKTGKSEIVLQNDGYVSFVVDYDFNPRYAVKAAAGGVNEIYFVDKPGKAKNDKGKGGAPAPRLFLKIPPEDSFTTAIEDFDLAGKTLYMVDSRGRDTAALVTADPTTGDVKIVAQDAKADIDDLLVDPKTRAVQAAGATYDRRKWTAVDKSIAGDLDALAKVTDGDFYVVSRSSDDKRWVVVYTMSDGPVRYYLYDRAKKKADFLFTNQPALEKVKLAKMLPRVIKARDGLDLVST